MSRQNSGGFRFGYNSSGTPIFWTGESGGPSGTFSITSSKNLSVGKFSHLVVTYSSSKQLGSMYMDGQLVGTGTGTFNIPVGGAIRINNMSLGEYPNGDSSFDDVRYYATTLTAMEVKNIYALGVLPHLAFK